MRRVAVMPMATASSENAVKPTSGTLTAHMK